MCSEQIGRGWEGGEEEYVTVKEQVEGYNVDFLERLLRKISVRVRLILAFTLILALVTGIMGVYATSVMSDKIVISAQEKLSSDLNMGWQMLDYYYPGDWAIKNGQLYKGNVLMEENYELIDKIGELTGGDTVTIFKGDTRVSTNVMNNNERCVGTQVSAVVAETVLKKGEKYLGRAEVVGTWNETAYEPIRDAKGEIIGIWYVGVPATPYDEAVNEFRNTMLVYSIIGILVGFLIAFLIAFTVYTPLRRITAGVEVLSQGDLTHKVPVQANDEPGQVAAMVNQMADNMLALIGGTRQLSGKVGKASAHITGLIDSSTRMVGDMAVQAEKMDDEANRQVELAGGSRLILSEMSSAIQQVAANSSDVSNFVAGASCKAQEGGEEVEKAIKQMDVISDAVNSTAVIVEGLGKKSEEIGQIVVLITDIANQTNLLALNAAIEAARAGEQGKGFAVVAEEVRKLAEESSQAACRISDLIKEMQAGAGNAVKAMQAGTREVSNGIEVVAKAGNAFREITEAVATVNTQIQEVSAASEEMAASAGTAYDSVQETAHAAEKNSRYAQDISRLTVEQLQSIETMNQSVAELNQVVGELEQSIQYFKV